MNQNSVGKLAVSRVIMFESRKFDNLLSLDSKLLSLHWECLQVSILRPLTSSENSNFQNEAKCKTFLSKMSFICMAIENYFRINIFVLSLTSKQTPGVTRK